MKNGAGRPVKKKFMFHVVLQWVEHLLLLMLGKVRYY